MPAVISVKYKRESKDFTAIFSTKEIGVNINERTFGNPLMVNVIA